ncbi:hypothetical protein DERF_013617 [Dermatophagoides farinae]|uniref:Uncharacterized protein n=1 Tax=Dermatophagoides farinae TaxID=6954 RepID=A0A922HRI8_DERFA|nr:hypothetical protein DERF_013617 [Dermatophagoides farinae]
MAYTTSYDDDHDHNISNIDIISCWFSPTTTIHQQQQQQQLPSNKTLRKSLFQHIFGALRCTQ